MNRQVTIKASNTREFFTSLVKFLASFYDLTVSLDKELIACLCNLADESGSVVVNPIQRKKLLVELEVKNSHLSNSIKRLRDKGLISGEQGKYQLSSILIWKGLEDALTNDDLRLTIKFIK
jgi:predicted transcriptional regulator